MTVLGIIVGIIYLGVVWLIYNDLEPSAPTSDHLMAWAWPVVIGVLILMWAFRKDP